MALSRSPRLSRASPNEAGENHPHIPHLLQLPQTGAKAQVATASQNTPVKLLFKPASSHWAPSPKTPPEWLPQVQAAGAIHVTGSSSAGAHPLSNLTLARARANTVRNYLTSQGVNPQRITLKAQLVKESPSQATPLPQSRLVQISWSQ